MDRVLVCPASPIWIDFIQKAGKANIFAKRSQRSENNIFLDTTIFPVKNLTSYAKMISLCACVCFFFVVVVVFFAFA